MSQEESRDHHIIEMPSMTQKMAVVAIAKFFSRFPLLEALQLVLDGIDCKRFPTHIRAEFETVRSELIRVLDQPFEYLVHRLVKDIQNILEGYLDNEAILMLEGLYGNARELRETSMTEYHSLEFLEDLGEE